MSEDKTIENEVTKDPAEMIVETINEVKKSIGDVTERLDGMDSKIEEASKVQYPHGSPFSIRKGEDPLSSRPYSLMRVAKAMRAKADNDSNWQSDAELEFELSEELRKGYYDRMNFNGGGGFIVPLGADLLPAEETRTEEGQSLGGVDRNLIRKCRDVMASSMTGFDPDEYAYVMKSIGLQKDLSANNATTGGALVAFASQGELIEQLRAVEVMSQAGAQQITLPPQGSIAFPRQTSGVTITSTSEGATISESTPATSRLTLQAKPYTGLVDIPDELMRFATSVSIEAWLRGEFIRDLALKTDSDMISGAGGAGIQGLINYSAARSVTASTTGVNGDTLDPEDPMRLYSDIADQNAPVDRGFFYAMTNTLWGGVSTRRADAVSGGDAAGGFVFNVATQSVGGGRLQKTLNGEKVITSTQVPTDRAKGGATDLTMLIGGVGAEWLIARAGVVEIKTTDSDASKFQTRTSTMRGTVYMDAGPRHENSFGYIDDVLNS